MSSVIILKDGGTQLLTGSPLGKLILNVLSLGAAYCLNFVACDLLYHDFNIQQSLKGAYWFYLGPVLFVFGPTLKWVQAWLKSLIFKTKSKIKKALQDFVDDHLPPIFHSFTAIPVNIFANNFLTEEQLEIQRQELEYLKKINRILL